MHVALYHCYYIPGGRRCTGSPRFAGRVPHTIYPNFGIRVYRLFYTNLIRVFHIFARDFEFPRYFYATLLGVCNAPLAKVVEAISKDLNAPTNYPKIMYSVTLYHQMLIYQVAVMHSRLPRFAVHVPRLPPIINRSFRLTTRFYYTRVFHIFGKDCRLYLLYIFF